MSRLLTRWRAGLFTSTVAALVMLVLVQRVPAVFVAPWPQNQFFLVVDQPPPPLGFNITSELTYDISGHRITNIITANLHTVGMAIGPDGNTYILTQFGQIIGLPSFKVTYTPAGLTFGPDGNLYVGNTQSGAVFRYCGPFNGSCSPGAPFGANGNASDPTFVAQNVVVNGSSIVFGPDGSLYVSSGQDVVRFCGPPPTQAPPCSEGDPSPSSNGQVGVVGSYIPRVAEGAVQDLSFGPDGQLYVLASAVNVTTSANSRELLVFAGPKRPTAGSFIEDLVAPGIFSIPGARTMDFGPDRNLYISYIDGSGVVRYQGPNCASLPACYGQPDSHGTFALQTIGSAGFAGFLRFSHYTGASTASLALLVSDQQGVKRFDPSTGNPMPGNFPGSNAPLPGALFASSSSLSAIAPLFGAPAGLAFGPDGNLYVADQSDNQLLALYGSTGQPLVNRSSVFASGNSFVGSVKFDPAGDNLWTTDGFFLNQFTWPSASEVLLEGNGGFSGTDMDNVSGLAFGLIDQAIYLADNPATSPPQPSIFRWDRSLGDPTVPGALTTFVSDPGHLAHPFDVAFSPLDDDLYASDQNGKRIVRFHGDTGTFRDVFVPSQPGNPTPYGLAFDPTGGLYVAYDDGNIRRFNGSTGQQTNIAGTASSPTFITIGPASGGSDTAAPVGPPAPVEVLGTVYGGDTSHPIPNTQVIAGVLLHGSLIGCTALGLLPGFCTSVTTDGTGTYDFQPAFNTGLLPGDYVLTAFPPAASPFFPRRISITVPAGGENVNPVIVLTAPPPLPPGLTLVDSTGSSLSVVNGVPVINSSSTTTITVPGCAGGKGTYSLSLNFTAASGGLAVQSGFTGNVVTSGSLTETSSGSFTATIPNLGGQSGLLNFSISFTCLDRSTNTSTFVVYIDPSGTVVDDSTGQPIAGATVTLLRSNTVHGALASVPNGSGLMSPSNRKNPDQTNSVGGFGWDVTPGFYQLQASAPGYTCDPANPPQGFTCANGAVVSGVFAVPPAAVDLRLPLHHIVAPADTTPPVTSAIASPLPNVAGWNNSNVTVTLHATDSETGGTGVKQITYAATGPQPVATTTVAGDTISLTVSTEGVTTITFFGTDNAGNVEASQTVTIQLDKTAPTITSSVTPGANANGWNNTPVSVGFQCSDALSGLAEGSPPVSITLSSEGAGQSVARTCIDRAGNSASTTVIGINIDMTPPTVACTASPSLLWPPDDKLIPVSLAVDVQDGLSGSAGFVLVSLTSNEPNAGSPDMLGFVTGTASTSGQLREQRLGSGTGRVYTFTYSGADLAGNRMSCVATVSVPHDQSP
jgi:sugar lactone lactonase YvrE